MRVAFLGASHWHLSLYLEPVLEIANCEVVGVHDPDPAIVAKLVQRLGCLGDTDFARLCQVAKPDFVFALGRHSDMHRTAEYLIAERIPFALEKPCGLSQRGVAALAEEAGRNSVFGAVPLVFRNGEFAAELSVRAAGNGIRNMSFRFIAGATERYRRSGCDWMLDPTFSGGGCTINLAVHFFDLCLSLLGPHVRVCAAAMSNATFGQAVEDSSLVVVEADGRLALVETGYLLPAPNALFDMHYSVRCADSYIIAIDPFHVETVENDGARKRVEMVTTNVPLYRPFTFDVLERVRLGEPPLASLADFVPVMGLVEEAYRRAGKQHFHSLAG